jgi:hypothetical protein
MYTQGFMGPVFRYTLFFSVVISVVTAGLGLWTWFWGIWVAFFWIQINNYLIRRMIQMVGEGQADRKKIMMFSLIKFPVLYLAGLLILLSEWVALKGVFVGFTIYFVSLTVFSGIHWLLKRFI